MNTVFNLGDKCPKYVSDTCHRIVGRDTSSSDHCTDCSTCDIDGGCICKHCVLNMKMDEPFTEEFKVIRSIVVASEL